MSRPCLFAVRRIWVMPIFNWFLAAAILREEHAEDEPLAEICTTTTTVAVGVLTVPPASEVYCCLHCSDVWHEETMRPLQDPSVVLGTSHESDNEI
jgi:hypothetical protein